MIVKIVMPRISVVLLIFFLAGLPLLLGVEGSNITLTWSAPLQNGLNYVKGLAGGDSFMFFAGKTPRNFLDILPIYFLTSSLYLVSSAFIGVNLGILLGMLSSRLRSGLIKDTIGFLSAVPDFIIILLLQRGAVFLHDLAGMRVMRVATVTLQEPAIFLPLFTMALLPAMYLIRTVSNHTDYVLGQDYIQCAKAKGLSPVRIYLHHVFTNIIPYIKADTHKIAGIMLANLFISEYLFNIFGLTRLLFKYGFQFFRFSYTVNYQYNLVVNTLLAIALLYEGFSLLLRGYITCWERWLCR